MTAADDAYTEAQRRIAEAKRTGSRALNLNVPAARALEVLPPEISELPWLRVLSLSNTAISDLSPLARNVEISMLALRGTQVVSIEPISGMAELADLFLQDTSVSDLMPLAKLPKLASSHSIAGLRFENTAASRSDQTVAKIAEIENNSSRAQELFRYLERVHPLQNSVFASGSIEIVNENWQPPTPPEPEPLLNSLLVDGQLELAPDPPTEAERHERLKRVLHQRLQERTPHLTRSAGNVFPRLAAKARILQGLVDASFEELDLLSIHLEIEDLAERAQRGREDGQPYSEDVAYSLGDVARLGPGLTLGHPEVDAFINRVRAARDHPTAEHDATIHATLSAAILADSAANGPRSREMEARLTTMDDQIAASVAITAKHHGLLRLIGMAVASHAPKVAIAAVGGFSAKVAYDLFGQRVAEFLRDTAPLLLEVAATYGAPMAIWFGAVMGPIFLALGVKEEVVKRKTAAQQREDP